MISTQFLRNERDGKVECAQDNAEVVRNSGTRNKLHANRKLLHLLLSGNGADSPKIRGPPTKDKLLPHVLQDFRMAVPVVFTDTSSELFPRQKSCSNATSCHERPQSIVFRCGREKESTRRCIEWYTIRRSELHVTPIPCSNKRRKTTENAGEPNA